MGNARIVRNKHILEEKMISNFIIVGLVLALAVSVALPVGCAIYCVKKSNTRGIASFLIMGFAVSVIANNLGNLASSLLPLKDLMESSIVLYIVIIAVVIGGFDLAGRYLGIKYISKNGLGLYKSLALGVGFSFGQVMLQSSYYFQLLSHARMINEGTFYDTMIEQEGITAEAIAEYQEAFYSIHNATYISQAIEQAAAVFLNIALILILVKFILDRKVAIGAAIVGGIRIGYEFLRLLTYYLHSDYMNAGVSETISIVLNSIVNVGVLIGTTLCIIKLMKQIPAEVNTNRNNGAPKKKEQVVVSDKKAWQEVKQLTSKDHEKKEEE